MHISRDVIFEELKGWQWKETEMRDMYVSSSFIVVGSHFETTSDDEDVSQFKMMEGGEQEQSGLSTPQSQVASSRLTGGSE